ncbi:S-adenosylmethionine permease gap4 [Scheffersomyces spartinae]|uniref:S-adenosylmethionine permease gap4 n=1 Tax=Scheffersomyces spartinae TaxID=45513 RepID=A0A9P7VBE0_9ASCO|nr:S-adenosylmethionine permease gap4 [Scheffersomyces spartinae]KAG7194690.1 S-adenosylmethionine permease gap4 [Scheffersomyces spartinae]
MSEKIDSLEITTNHATGYSSNGGYFSRMVDSFKPMEVVSEDDSTLDLVTKGVHGTANQPLVRDLKNRHVQMIAIGGSIGTGLFIGSGYALSVGGPAAVLISYVLAGYAIFCMVMALGELSVQFPISGSFNAFFSRFVDPTVGFTLGLMYALSWLISFPSELIAAAMTIQYWNQSIDPALWVAILFVLIIGINFFGVRGFGEAEFWLSLIKVIAVIGFIILGICITCGVGSQGYIGGKYWHNPGAFNGGLKGVCNAFVSAAFSFGGVELVALAAAETENPRKSLPKATKQVFWRIFIFYICTAIVIGCLVPYTNEQLLNGSGITASPFVIAVQNGGIKVVPHIMNAVILVAVISLGNSSVYGCSRSLASMAAQGLLPSWFGYIDRKGRPLVSIGFISAFGLLGFLVDSTKESVVFTWLFALCSVATFIIWGTVCVVHIRWRAALKAQGRSTDEIIFVSPMGLFGSYSGALVCFLMMIGEIWIALFPHGSADVNNFFQLCLSIPIMIVMYVGHKTYTRSWNRFIIKLEDIDLDTGRREVDIDLLRQELEELKLAYKEKPIWKKLLQILF